MFLLDNCLFEYRKMNNPVHNKGRYNYFFFIFTVQMLSNVKNFRKKSLITHKIYTIRSWYLRTRFFILQFKSLITLGDTVKVTVNYFCPIIVVTLTYKFYALNVTIIMGQRWYCY